MTYCNPYSGATFFEFFAIFFGRLWQLISGQISWSDLASDEIQIFVLLGVALACALVGTFLVLRKMAMLANALSHTVLLGIVLAYLLTVGLAATGGGGQINFRAMAIAAILTGIGTTFLTEFFHKTLRLQEDASIGLIFTALFAVGITLVTLFTRNAHIGTEVVMGNADALQRSDIALAWQIFIVDAVLCLLFFKEYRLTTFDAPFAKAIGFNPQFFNYLLMVQLSATAIGAFRAVGVILVLAFLVGPTLAARLLTHRLSYLLYLSMGLGAIAAFGGVATARHFLSVWDVALSTGGLVVCWILILFVLAALVSPQRGVLAALRRRRASSSY